MFFNKLKIFILTLMASVFLVGCTSSLLNSNKYTDIEKLIMSVILPTELSSVKEVENKEGKKDLTVTLNLEHSVKTVALDNALFKITSIIELLETNFKEEMNDYNFIINANVFDVYGNEKEEKILEISIDNDEVEKINFTNFNYRNLEILSDIKKFNYLSEDMPIEDNSDNKLDKDEQVVSDKETDVHKEDEESDVKN